MKAIARKRPSLTFTLFCSILASFQFTEISTELKVNLQLFRTLNPAVWRIAWRPTKPLNRTMELSESKIYYTHPQPLVFIFHYLTQLNKCVQFKQIFPTIYLPSNTVYICSNIYYIFTTSIIIIIVISSTHPFLSLYI